MPARVDAASGWNRILPDARLRLQVLVTIALVSATAPALAYRPFDGTDAAVAEEGVFELEAGIGRQRLGEVNRLAIPALVFNYGLPHDTEVVLEGQFDRTHGGDVEGQHMGVGDTALSLKHVFRRGTRREGEGPSVALECSVLLPEVNGSSNAGGQCAGILSNKWDSLSLHLNAALGRTREHTTGRSLGLIAEGPDSWEVRPVAEVVADRETGGTWLNSALGGAIWQYNKDLALDVAFRHAATSSGTLNEVRVGATWSYQVGR